MVKSKKLKGFTLIELLIVIIIIGILATIAIISYGNASVKAKRAATVQVLNDGIKGAAVCAAAGETPNTALGGAVCPTAATTTADWPSIPKNAAAAQTLNGFYNSAGTAVTAATKETTSGTYDYGTLTLTNGNTTYDITCTPDANCK